MTEGLLGIYQELLSLTFTRDTALEAGAWHEDVKAFQVTDAESTPNPGPTPTAAPTATPMPTPAPTPTPSPNPTPSPTALTLTLC